MFPHIPDVPVTAPTPKLHTLERSGDGQKNALTGQWPNRIFETVGAAELHSFSVPSPRARALVYVGGGYTKLMYDKEGVEVALWLATLGIEAHILVHRLPGTPDGAGGLFGADIALQDGLLALDHLSRQTPQLPLIHFGLSSGGHLSGVMACQPHALQSKGALIAYAPLNTNHRDHKFPVGKPDFPPAEKQAFYDAWPIGLAEHPHGCPSVPVFLAYALLDRQVAVENALRFAQTASARELDYDLHVFSKAPHGFALRHSDGSHEAWPSLATRWIDRILATDDQT